MDSVSSIPDTPLLPLAVALGLGLLVGMQREWVEDKPLGLRSFALISLIGALLGLYSAEGGIWITALGLLAVTIAIFTHMAMLAAEAPVRGMTTELAGIVVYLIGAMTTTGWLVEAVVLGGVLTLLLHWKMPLHAWIEKIAPAEFQAVARFVLVSLVILPILPNRTFGPYDVLNPFQIWLMVVLIVGLNLMGYFGMRISSGRGSVLMGGVLGGLASSTATTFSFASRSRAQEAMVPVALVVILVASLLVQARIAVETLVVSPTLLQALAAPLALFSLIFAAVIAFFLLRFESFPGEGVATGNPAELGTALVFGLIYSVITFVSAAVSREFGEGLLYPVAVISGLTDVDAITLSTAYLFGEGRISQDTAWRLVFAANLSNLTFKAGVVAVLGGPLLRRRLLPVMLALVLLGAGITILWP